MHVTQHACRVTWYIEITYLIIQHVKNNGLVSLHVSLLTCQSFHKFAEVIFKMSCCSTCMLTYMHVELHVILDESKCM